MRLLHFSRADVQELDLDPARSFLQDHQAHRVFEIRYKRRLGGLDVNMREIADPVFLTGPLALEIAAQSLAIPGVDLAQRVGSEKVAGDDLELVLGGCGQLDAGAFPLLAGSGVFGQAGPGPMLDLEIAQRRADLHISALSANLAPAEYIAHGHQSD